MVAQWNKQTHTYKVVGNCHIQADVYQVDTHEKQPVILWVHGGALVAGSRTDIAQFQLEKYLDAGFTVICIDYRLAPETKLPSIIEDLKDACQWVYQHGSALFNIDPDRMAVIGHSAGGYLTLMTGVVLNPQPKVIVSFYGYGDIIGPWYSQPDPGYCQQEQVPVDNAHAAVGAVPLTESRWEKRYPFYLYCRQQGLWPREVAGQDPHRNPAWFSKYCPLQNVTSSYPPTLLIHGDQDTDVPCQQSLEMAAVLEQQHVPHKLLLLKGKGHAFDYLPDPLVSAVMDDVLAFLKQYC
jgi:acetyl esterase/lipase